MPGFNLNSAGFDSDANATYSDDGLTRKLWYENDYFEFSGQYSGDYPYKFKEELGIYFEGLVYNVTPEDHFEELTELLEGYQLDEIAEKIKDWDGEFVFMHRDTGSKSIYIINDSWGRLPVYYWKDKNRFIVSRNISRITHFAKPKYRQEGIAMSLLIGTNLGTETLWKKVQRMPPHSILHIHADGHFSLHEYFKLKTVNGKANFEKTSEKISQSFDEALKTRLEKLPQATISLSGGLDSRLIAASAKKQGLDVPYITYNRETGDDRLDADSSQEIVDRLEIKHRQTFQIPPAEMDDIEELIEIKQGLNYASMGYILPYYKMHATKGYSTITGDGGGKFFVDLSALRSIRSITALLKYILRYNSFCSIETAGKIAGVSPMKLEENLIEHLESYPVHTYADKYIYFLIREAGINWAFEGEDRNRQYVWSTSPFYHPKLIDLCLSIPQKSKEYGALYDHLYRQYPGNLQEVSNPNWKEVVSHRSRVKRIHDRQKMKSFLPQFVLDYKKDIPIDEFPFKNELIKLLEGRNQYRLDVSDLHVKNSMNFYWQLFTLLLVFRSSSN